MNTQDVQVETPAPRNRHWARRTHRVLGVSSLLFVALISASGLVLNHADALGLSRQAAGPWLLDIYGIELPPVDSAFAVNGTVFATSATSLYANGVELADGASRLIGAVAVPGGMVVASHNEFFVTAPDATLIERFAPDVAGPIRELGTVGERVVVALGAGFAEFDAGEMTLSISEPTPPLGVSWSQPTIPAAAEAERIGRAALGQAINWERVLLDLHSGRILPAVGRYLADITALCLLYMCFSGFLLWRRGR